MDFDSSSIVHDYIKNLLLDATVCRDFQRSDIKAISLEQECIMTRLWSNHSLLKESLILI